MISGPALTPAARDAIGQPGRSARFSVETREATSRDLGALLAVAQAFVAESGWGWTFDARASAATFGHAIAAPNGAVLVAEAPGAPALAGAAVVQHETDFVAERQGHVVKFYVAAWARGRSFAGADGRATSAGRALRDACDSWFAANGVRIAFACPTAMLGPRADRLFVTLFAKIGFAEMNGILVKHYPTAGDGRVGVVAAVSGADHV